MAVFQMVTDESLAAQIGKAQRRIVFVAPGVTKGVATALVAAYKRKPDSVTVILDSNEEAYRIGFGDPEGLKLLHEYTSDEGIPLRLQAGIRIGLAVLDETLTIWAPTPKAVEAERKEEEPNAIVLGATAADTLHQAVGGGTSSVPQAQAEIGKCLIPPEDTEKTVNGLAANPPAPFDLSQKTRVFSTKFQFVEFEVRGAEWTQRSIKISSLLLNADLPDEIQDILETQIRPYHASSEVEILAPTLVQGEVAYSKSGERIMVPTRQANLDALWKSIVSRYLVKLKGFGWLIRRSDMSAFRTAIACYEEILTAWVEGFRVKMQKDEERLVAEIVKSIESRVARAAVQNKGKKTDFEAEVRKGLTRMRTIEPNVRIVMKDVSWESTSDVEFTEAMRAALPPEELRGWFEVFEAAPERRS